MVSSVILIDVLSRLLGIARFLINPKLLGAEAYGRLGLVSAVLLYAAFCDLGINREFELKYPHSSHPYDTVKAAVFSFLKRAILPSVILCAVVSYLTDFHLGLAALPYIVFFGLTEILLIVFRAQRNYWVLNVYSLGVALLLTFSTFWIAPLFGVLGIVAFQSLVSVIAVIILGILFLKKRPLIKSELEPLLNLQGRGALWLFLGQLVQVSWLVVDRFYLAHRISAQEMGFWTLGTLPGAMLTGVATTIGALHMASWIKKERGFLVWSEVVIYSGAWLVGTFIYGPFIRFFLPAYSGGIDWNLRLIAVQGGIGILFFYDCYRRAQILSARESREWFQRRLYVTLLGIAVLVLGGLFWREMDPRRLILIALNSLLFSLWIWEGKWGLAGMQFVIGGASLV
jgi:hypothetical protein